MTYPTGRPAPHSLLGGEESLQSKNRRRYPVGIGEAQRQAEKAKHATKMKRSQQLRCCCYGLTRGQLIFLVSATVCALSIIVGAVGFSMQGLGRPELRTSWSDCLYFAIIR